MEQEGRKADRGDEVTDDMILMGNSAPRAQPRRRHSTFLAGTRPPHLVQVNVVVAAVLHGRRRALIGDALGRGGGNPSKCEVDYSQDEHFLGELSNTVRTAAPDVITVSRPAYRPRRRSSHLRPRRSPSRSQRTL